MNIDQVFQTYLGQLVFQVIVLQAQVEDLKRQLAEKQAIEIKEESK